MGTMTIGYCDNTEHRVDAPPRRVGVGATEQVFAPEPPKLNSYYSINAAQRPGQLNR
jgi:hypothetical protein